jgi:hypothetical protein
VLPASADHDRLSAQFRIAQQFDGRIERIHVQMRNAAHDGSASGRPTSIQAPPEWPARCDAAAASPGGTVTLTVVWKRYTAAPMVIAAASSA